MSIMTFVSVTPLAVDVGVQIYDFIRSSGLLLSSVAWLGSMFWYGTLWVMNSDDDHEVKAKKKAMMVATMAYFVILLCGWGLMKIMDITGAGGWSSAGDSYIRNVVTTSSSCIGDKTGNCAKNISVTPTGGSTSSSDASSSALQGLDGLTQ